MQIILLDKVHNIGVFGEIVNVKSGYARNFLLPKGKAINATKNNIKLIEIRSIEFKNKLYQIKFDAKLRAEKINNLGSITLHAKSGNEGKLFGSIGVRNIVDAIINAGIKVYKKEIILKNGFFRTTGCYDVSIKLHNNVFAYIKVNIVSS